MKRRDIKPEAYKGMSDWLYEGFSPSQWRTMAEEGRGGYPPKDCEMIASVLDELDTDDPAIGC